MYLLISKIMLEEQSSTKSSKIDMKLLVSQHYNELLMNSFIVAITWVCFRSGNPTQAGEREDPGLHPLSESPRQESGVLR